MKHRDDQEKRLIRLLGSTSRVRILTLFYNNPGANFYQREIMYETGQSLQAVQRELENLVDLGIIKRQSAPKLVYYEINTNSPLFKPLSELIGLGSNR